jgi:hypothetical protein
MDEGSFQFSTEQLRVHDLTATSKGFTYKNRSRIDSPFNPQFDKIAFYLPYLEDLNITQTGENDIINIDMTRNHLVFYEMRQPLPPMKVAPEHREEIEIAWGFDPSSGFWGATIMILDGKPKTTLPVSMHRFYEGACVTRNLASIKEDSGNIPELLEWNTELPAHTVSCYPLWSWVKGGTNCSIPLSKNQSLSFLVQKRKFNEILMMRQRVKKANGEEEWRQIRFDPSYLVLNGNEDFKLPQILAKGYYGRSLNDEVNVGIQQCLKCGVDGQIEYPFEDIIIMESKTKITLGGSTEFTPTASFINKTCIVTCKNLTAAKYGYQYNYSTNSVDHRLGLNPVSRIDLVDLKDNKVVQSFDRRSLDGLACRLFPKNHRRGKPDHIPGFNVFTFTLRPAEVIDANGFDLGLNKFRIDVFLDDNGIGKKVQSTKTEYQVTLFICTARRLIYKPTSDGGLKGDLV